VTDQRNERRWRQRLVWLRADRGARLDPRRDAGEPAREDQDEAYASLFSDLGLRDSRLSLRAARRLEG